MLQWNTIKDLKVVKNDIFVTDVETIEDILNEMTYTDPEFTYNGREMMIASERQTNGKYIYVVQDNTPDLDENKFKFREIYKSMEDLLMNYKFKDGVSLIDFLTKPSQD